MSSLLKLANGRMHDGETSICVCVCVNASMTINNHQQQLASGTCAYTEMKLCKKVSKATMYKNEWRPVKNPMGFEEEGI